MELMAPAGSVEHFTVALEAGADAVYVGAPRLNARNASRELRLEEIGAMSGFAHERGKRLYVAINSLIREADLTELVHTLSYLETVEPDGLIVQDLGLIELVHTHFSHLPLHASTLMLAHNSAAVEMLGDLGCSRVVLAREMTLQEIETIVRQSSVEIEVFVHGAMCFSYSGGCLFSSFLGGKSGLRGNCVQPCRRKYSTAGGKPGGGPGRNKSDKSGYLFSMNDLEGLEFVPKFRDIGVAALKIEGRLRSTTYVDHVVRAYRLVMDASAGEFDEALREGSKLLDSALGRKSSSGYFITPKPKDAIATHHSGNIGTYLGRVEAIQRDQAKTYATVALLGSCELGDRVRLHFERSGERLGFTVKELQPYTGTETETKTGPAQRRVKILLPPKLKANQSIDKMELYRVDVAGRLSETGFARAAGLARHPLRVGQLAVIERRRDQVLRGIGVISRPNSAKRPSKRAGKVRNAGAELWLRIDSVEPIFQSLPIKADRFLLNMDRRSISQVGQLRRHLGRNSQNIIWALPQVIHGRTMGKLIRDIDTLIKSGFRAFQIAHLSQMKLFENRKVTLFGDYTLNLLNSRAIRGASALGLSGIQFCIETDRTCLQRSVAAYLSQQHNHQPDQKRGQRGRRTMLGLTVYGAPPLFVSRIEAPHLPYNKTILSPKQEGFVIHKKDGETYTRPQKPFSLLPFVRELSGIGLDYLVIDISGMSSAKKELLEISKRIAGKERMSKLPSFNYLGVLE